MRQAARVPVQFLREQFVRSNENMLVINVVSSADDGSLQQLTSAFPSGLRLLSRCVFQTQTCSRLRLMNALASSHSLAFSINVQSQCKLTAACPGLFRRRAGKFEPFVSAATKPQQRFASAVDQQHTSPAIDLSRRSALQQVLLATAALSLGTAVNLSTPQASHSALVQFPVADLRNQYYLVCNSKPDLDACPYNNTVHQDSHKHS